MYIVFVNTPFVIHELLMYHVHRGVKEHTFQLCNLSDVKIYLKKKCELHTVMTYIEVIE